MEIKKNCNNCTYYGPEIGSICMNCYKHANWQPNERLQKKINIASGSAMDVINKYIKEDINMTKTAYNYFFKNGDSIKTTHKIIFEKDHEMDIRDNIKDVIFNDPATIILWKDGSKTVVKSQDGELYDPEKGFAMAIAKKVLGGQGNYFEVFKKWVPEVKCDICGKKIEPIYRNPGDLLEGIPYYDKVRVEHQHKHGVGFYDYRLCQVCALNVLEATNNLEKHHKN